MKFVALLLLLALASFSASAQQQPADMEAMETAEAELDCNHAATTESDTATADQPWTQEVVLKLSYIVICFTGATLLAASVLLWLKDTSAADVLKLFGIISILGLSALLLIAGYSNEQLTPIIGLFGAIAGYLLGKDTSPPRSPPP